MTGEYRSQFIIEQNPANILFVRNSYNPGNCKMSDIVPFNLVTGTGKCNPDTTNKLVYNATGEIVARKIKNTL